jgi:hypothetical protein
VTSSGVMPEAHLRSDRTIDGHAEPERVSEERDLLGDQASDDARLWVESLDDETKRTLGFAPDWLGRVAVATTTLHAAQAALVDTVDTARAHGQTWTHIATALGSSPHAAGARRGHAPPRRQRRA